MPLLYHAYVYLEFLILACTIYILAPDYILLKFISSADKCNRKKYLKDFLNGSLYMNTLNYFWNEYYRDSQNKKQEEGGKCY